MTDPYIRKKADQAAKLLSAIHGIDYRIAIGITERLWEEARGMILREVSAEEWKGLSLADRAEICRGVISCLLDKKRLLAMLSDGRRTA